MIKVGLCPRHKDPVTEYLFPDTISNPMDFSGMQKTAYEKLSSMTTKPWIEILVIYASGLTPALLAAINAAKRLEFWGITVMHHNRDTGEYLPQDIA